jgi:NAD(P)-dependent dehydrogenase (short-subunit alcohol dehydrogenase family)
MNILITGATSGIGREAALHLARRGHRVFATGRRPEALDALQETAAGLPLETLWLDVKSRATIESSLQEIERRTDGRGVEALVNNAGYGQYGPLELITDEDFRAQFDTNVFGLMALTRAVIPQMRRRGHGRIVNISSVAGRISFPFGGAYSATKFAVEALSDALRIELAPFGIAVVLIEPGPIKTGFGKHARDTMAKYRDADSPHSVLMARFDEIWKRWSGSAPGPEGVVKAIERAITARHPAPRYVRPRRYRLVLALMEWAPARWTDAALRRALGIRRKMDG